MIKGEYLRSNLEYVDKNRSRIFSTFGDIGYRMNWEIALQIGLFRVRNVREYADQKKIEEVTVCYIGCGNLKCLHAGSKFSQKEPEDSQIFF